MGTNEDSINTRAKLIAAAGKLFAEYGFNGVSVRQIATEAGLPLGAMNYHFQGKEGLYRETLQEACRSVSLTPKKITELQQLPPEDALRNYIRDFATCNTTRTSKSWEITLLNREWSMPGPYFSEALTSFFAPEIKFLAQLIGQMTATPAESPDTEFAAFTLRSQLCTLILNRHLAEKLLPEFTNFTKHNPDWLFDKLVAQIAPLIKA